MANIKHIVYYMLENRSFDNVLGWLYDEKDSPKIRNIPAQSPPTPPTYDGLKLSYYNEDGNGKKCHVIRGTENHQVPSVDPHEEYNHVNNQLFESYRTPARETPPSMGGFLKDFTDEHDHEQIMQSYTPEELPVLNGLARHFAISDRYFSSVPTQTNCNRAFAACGNSLGKNHKKLEAWVNNRRSGFLEGGQPRGDQFSQKSMWNVLSENCRNKPSDWMIFHNSGAWWQNYFGLEGYSYTRDLVDQLKPCCFDDHFGKVGDSDGTEKGTFFEKLKSGTLPTFSFLEPIWGLGKWVQGNDYHPPSNVEPGEVFLKSLYDALVKNKSVWESTLFIVNFDEHGGTYDHVPPPWTASPPWANCETPSPDRTETPRPWRKFGKEPFQFDRFGVRVPLILVSPWVEESTVFRAEGSIPFDHTSVIATILKLMDIPKSKWKLGARVANAPTFDSVLTDCLRTDIPAIETNRNWKPVAQLDPPCNDIQRTMAFSIVHRVAEQKKCSPEDLETLLQPLVKAQSVSQVAKAVEDAVVGLRSLGRL